MVVSYDLFTEAFLSKVTEYNFCKLSEQNRQALVDGYMKRACAQFSEVCKNVRDLDDANRTITMDDLTVNELDEIVEIVTEGMLVQWMKPYTYKQENLENMLNTADFSSYSPAELLKRVVDAYKLCKREFVVRSREYSYRHGDITDLHL